MTTPDSTTYEPRTTAPAGRTITLVLVTPDGSLVGRLPSFPGKKPWWADAQDVVDGAREHFGLDVALLRLLSADSEDVRGGTVTYLAEIAEPVEALPWPGHLDDHPLRQTWARPGGPRQDVEWAAQQLLRRGWGVVERAEQIRTWNLSSLWRLTTAARSAWLKVVPPFFAHEGRLLERLQDSAVPRLIAHDGGRVLLAEIEGDDLYDAPLEAMLAMVTLLVELQARWIGRAEELRALGLPDWRPPGLVPAIAETVSRVAPELTRADFRTLQSFVGGLGERFQALGAAGIGDTLVHGDFHPGNVRGDGQRLTLLDWGDSGVGHPLLDAAAFLERVAPKTTQAIRDHWAAAWRAVLPGADADLGFDLLKPVAAARQALIYQNFLDRIEPSEHPYHRRDPAIWLARAAELARAEP